MNCAAVEWALAQTAPSPTAKLVLIALASRTEDGRLQAGQAEIAQIVQMTDRSVRTALKLLEVAGLIRRQNHAGSGKGREAASIILAFQELEATGKQKEPISACIPEIGSACPVDNPSRVNKYARAHAATKQITTPTELSSEPFELVSPSPISRAKRKHSIGNLAYDAKLQEFAAQKGFLNGSGERLFEAFRDHHLAKGSKFVDWHAAWRNWVNNEIKWHGDPNERDHRPQQQQRRGPRSAVEAILSDVGRRPD